ncbi:ERI1 exoribonuclease 2-like isoform X2 [Mya arenaria]|uniref:ERI1 exoribonuclease 2-like isoform X2 n=1 Tax=Mya arenaria TaxID=6604 RepID=UPI0022E84029|nr:ERI1 exoribonuclease 2-like isoform X2 [Mya arenaria]
MKSTKELARELGLIRKRTLSTSGINLRKGSAANVEFPAVLLNTETGEIESVFHHYVQPQEQPTLSAFCNELTGITQEQVDNGIPINLCLKRFSHWLEGLRREKGVVLPGTHGDRTINTTSVTWSDWDLGVCLQYECKRKQILRPPQLGSWIDLRATYRKFYDRKPNGLNGALQDVGITFEGREHSGVDDAKNTAKLAYRMIRDGCVMKVTKTLKTHERSASCNPAISTKLANNQPTLAQTVANKNKSSKMVSALTPKKSSPKYTSPVNKRGNSEINCKVKANTNSPISVQAERLVNNQSRTVSLMNNKSKTVAPINNQSKTWASVNNQSKTMAPINNQSKRVAPINNQSKRVAPINNQLKQVSLINNRSAKGTPNNDLKNTNERTTIQFNKSRTPTKVISAVLTPKKSAGLSVRNVTASTDGLKIQKESFHKSPAAKSNKNTPSKTSRLNGTYQVNSLPVQHTFLKNVQGNQLPSKKRKEFTPVKSSGYGNSPARKAPRKISPMKKLSVKDIYVDPVSDTEKMEVDKFVSKCSPVLKPGLKEKNLNARETIGSVSKKDKCLVVNQAHKPNTEFKVPQALPVRKSEPTKRLSFSTSTPQSRRTEQSFNGPKNCSPILNPPFQSSDLQTPLSRSGSLSNSTFKTPSNASSVVKTPNNSTMFRTPGSSVYSGAITMNGSSNISTNGNLSCMKITPPLCNCGRRSKRRMVQSPGQNMGRFFFSCSVRKGIGSTDGCKFFKWEVNPMNNRSLNSSNGSSYVSKQFTPVMKYASSCNTCTPYENVQRRNLGVRTNSCQKVHIR